MDFWPLRSVDYRTMRRPAPPEESSEIDRIDSGGLARFSKTGGRGLRYLCPSLARVLSLSPFHRTRPFRIECRDGVTSISRAEYRNSIDDELHPVIGFLFRLCPLRRDASPTRRLDNTSAGLQD